MNVIDRVSSMSEATSTSAIRPASAQSTSAPTAVSSANGDSVQVSKLGELMGQLKSLAETDPDRAKKVLTKISGGIAQEAQKTGDGKLAELAKMFGDAAQAGDMSHLEPKRREHPHGGPPPSAANAYAKANANPMQTVEAIISAALQG